MRAAARATSALRASHALNIKKLGGYLKGRPRLFSVFEWQGNPDKLTNLRGFDLAGCKTTTKSSSGGIVSLGEHTIKTYYKRQKVVALGAAEAELYAMVSASAESMAIQAYFG